MTIKPPFITSRGQEVTTGDHVVWGQDWQSHPTWHVVWVVEQETESLGSKRRFKIKSIDDSTQSPMNISLAEAIVLPEAIVNDTKAIKLHLAMLGYDINVED